MDIRKIEHVLLISISFLVVVPLLYTGRSLDANTFTSWRWVFSGSSILLVFSLLVPCLIIAYVLARLPVPPKYAYLSLFVMFLAAVVPFWTAPETILDASRYFIQAKSVKEYGVIYFLKEWGKGIDAWTDMPLIPLLYGLVFSLLGEARIYIQAFNTLLFAMTGLLTYLMGKNLWDEETGLHASLLLLGVPYLLTQVPLMLVDIPSMFFLTLALYLFLSVLETGGLLRTAAAALALLLALFCKYSIWPMLLVIPVMCAVFAGKDPEKISIRTFVVLLPAGLLASAVIAARADFFHGQLMLLKTYQWPGLSRWDEGWISAFFFQAHPFIMALAVYGTVRAVNEKDVRFLIAAFFFFLVVLLPIKRMRYMIPLLPLFALMASYGLNRIKVSGSGRFISLGIVASSLIIAYAAYLPFLKATSMSNLKLAGEYVDSLGDRSVEVRALPQSSSSGSTFAAIPLFDYYTRKNITSDQEWPGNAAADGNADKSSLRFTREMRKPAFYLKPKNRQVIVLISDRPVDSMLRGFGREVRKFYAADNIFKYQTIVTVYRKE